MTRTLAIVAGTVLAIITPALLSSSALATAAPSGACGAVEFVPAGAPRISEGTWYERIRLTVFFSDGHRETAQFPYPWVYPNGEQTDPWSETNLRRPNVEVPLKPPPPGTDPQSLPPLVRYVLEHSDAKGFTDLPGCAPSAASSRILQDTASSRELQAEIAAEIAAKPTRTLSFSDATPADAPVAIIAATFDSGDYHTAALTLACVTFKNRSAKSVAAVHIRLTYVAEGGRVFFSPTLERVGSFAPGVVVHGVHQVDGFPSRDVESMKNCRLNAAHGAVTPDRVTVTAVEFADGTAWPPASPAARPTGMPR